MQLEYNPRRAPKIPHARVAVLISKWYREYTDGILAKCLAVLKDTDCDEPTVYELPGSLEIPLAAQTLARGPHRPDAIICLGAIMNGETLHFDMIVDGCIRGLMDVMLREDIPIIVEIIPALNVEQLAARSGENNFNKGIEAALAAAEMIRWHREQKNRA